MTRISARARIAIGAAVLTVAGLAVAGSTDASAPPPTEPPSSELPGMVPVLDPDREAVLDDLLASADAAGFPLDRDCVARLIAQVPDVDVPILAQQMQDQEVVDAELTVATGGEDTPPLDTDTGVVGTTASEPESGEPALSPETEALGEQIIYCADGDADPALVAEAMAVIESEPDADYLDLECAANLLTTFSDETLQAIIDEAAPTTPTDITADSSTGTVGSDGSLPDVSMPQDVSDDVIAEGMMLIACAPDLLEGSTPVASAPDPAVVTVTSTG